MTRIALLGCGRIGKVHAATIARAEGAVVKAGGSWRQARHSASSCHWPGSG